MSNPERTRKTSTWKKVLPIVIVLAVILIIVGILVFRNTSKPASTFVMQSTSTPPGLDIHQVGFNQGCYPLYMPILSKTLDQSTYVANVAKDYKVEDGGKTVILYFDKDMKFHTGEALLMEDITGTLEWIRDSILPSHPLKALFLPMFDFQMTADETARTVTLTTAIATPLLIDALATDYSTVIDVSHAKTVGAEAFNEEPVFYATHYMTEFLPNSHIKYEKSEHFKSYNPETSNHGASKRDFIEVKFIENFTSVTSAFEGGTLDMITYLPATEVVKYVDRSDVALNRTLGYAYGLAMNPNSPMLSDQLVRQAIFYGLDRQAVVDTFEFGGNEGALPAYGLTTDRITGHNPATPQYVKSLLADGAAEKSEALFTQAGWIKGDDGYRYKNGEKLTISMITGTWTQPDQVAMIQIVMKDLGIEMIIEPGLAWGSIDTPNTVANLLANGQYDVYQVAYAMSGHGANLVSSLPGYPGVLDGTPRMAEIAGLLASEMDAQKRMELMDEYEKIAITEYCTYVPIFHPIEYSAIYSSKWTGYKFIDAEKTRWSWASAHAVDFEYIGE